MQSGLAASAAAALGSSGYGYSEPVTAEPSIPDIPRIQQEVCARSDEINQIISTLAKIADELFGAPPPSPASGGATQQPGQMGAVGTIHEQLQRLRHHVEELHMTAHRFARLV
jgi:hypothetical protein